MSHTNQQKGMLLARLLQKAMIFKNQKNNDSSKQLEQKLNHVGNNYQKNKSKDISYDSMEQSFFTAKDDLNQMLKCIYIQLFSQEKFNRDLQRYREIEIHPEKYKQAQDFNKQGKLMENIIFQIRELKKQLFEQSKEVKMLKKIQKDFQLNKGGNSSISKANPQSLKTINLQKQNESDPEYTKSLQQKIKQLELKLNEKDVEIVRINHLNQIKIIKIEQLEDMLKKQENLSQQCQINQENYSSKSIPLNQNAHNYEQKISLLKQELIQSKKIVHHYQKQVQTHQSEIQKYQLFITDLSNQIQICQKKLCSDKKEVKNKKIQTQFYFSNDSSSNEINNFQQHFYSPQTPNFRQTSIADLVQVDSEFQQSRNFVRKSTFNQNDISKIDKKDVFSDKESLTLSQFSQTEQLRDIRNLTKQLSQAYDKIISLTYEVNNLKKENKNITNNEISTAFMRKSLNKEPQIQFKKLIKQK